MGLPKGQLCDVCLRRLTETAAFPTCVRCAASVGPYLDTRKGCTWCKKERFAFQRVYRLGSYRGKLAEACKRIKKLENHRLGSVLMELYLAHQRDRLLRENIEVVVPIPLHWRRRWWRGYNQAEFLAAHIARSLGKPLLPHALARTRATVPQSSLSPTERRKNLRRAFRCRNHVAIQERVVLLVDDVLTTGSTCHHAARALGVAGASRVVVAVLARGEGV